MKTSASTAHTPRRPRGTAAQFIRYIFVGGGATLIQWGILVVLKEVFAADANIANAIGFTGGLLFNFFISTRWVFGNSRVGKAAEFTAFALIGVVGLGINQGMIWLFDKLLSGKVLFGGLIAADKYYLIGQVLATGIAFFWNFFARKILIYSKGEE